ncbi:MAG: hypothetical protein ACI4EK_04375 [Wujia sp.]
MTGNVKQKNIYTMIYFVLMATYFIFGYEWMGDDVSVVDNLLPTLGEELQNLSSAYHGWSSRVIINSLCVILAHFPIWIWKGITIGLLVAMYRMLCDLFGENDQFAGSLFVLLLLYPMEAIVDVGWMATTISYLWPTVLAVMSSYSIVWVLAERKMSVWKVIGVMIVTVLAANKEEISVILTLVYGCAVLWLFLKKLHKKTSWIWAIQLLVSLVSVLFHLLSKDNASRYEKVGGQDTLFDKLEIGYSSTLQHLFMSYDLFFFVVLMIALIFVIKERKRILDVMVALLPVLTYLGFGIYGLILSDGVFDRFVFRKEALAYGLSISRGKYEIPMVWVILIVCTLSLLCVLYTLFHILNEKRFVIVGLFLACLIGRLTVGFANSGWSEYFRTYVGMYYALAIASANVLSRMEQSKEKKIAMIGICVIGMINNCVFLNFI